MKLQPFKGRCRQLARNASRRFTWAIFGLVSSVTFAADVPKLPPLSTVSDSPRLSGKFVWADLVTDNVTVAQQFYSRLFGWTFAGYGDYLVAANDERPLCGMFQRPRPADRTDARPRWFGYISVPDVARAQRTITKSGGRVLAAPRKLPGRGEQAVFADPEGAVFGVVKSSSGDPPDFLAEPGDWIWVELMSRDARKAGAYYRAVAGYEVVENDTSARPDDFVFVSKGYARAAALTIPGDRPQLQPTWLLFVRVKSVSECVAQVGGLGGKVLLAPNERIFGGKLALIADPTGAEVGVVEWSDELLKGGR